MKSENISIEKLFCTADRTLYPSQIPVQHDLKSNCAQIDIVVTSHNLPELTNLTIENYLKLEKKTPVHITVVESSGKEKVFAEILEHPSVSKVLIVEDYKIKGKVHGYGSYGMALSAALGVYFTKAPWVFFSHSDMVGCQKDFISRLLNEMPSQARVASFTQRHIIPFTGSMLIRRELLEEQGLDWLPLDDNSILQKHPLWALAEPIHNLRHIDCGEQYVFSEIAKGNPVYVAASRGGSKNWWHDPLDYYETSVEKLWSVCKSAGPEIHFGALRADKTAFAEKYKALLRAGQEGFIFFEKPKFWRYSFDQTGNLSFIHHGRGTTLQEVKRWMKYVRAFNAS